MLPETDLFQTPLLYFQSDVIAENAAALRAALPDNGRLIFSVKSFPEKSLLESLKPHVDGFDISNSYEEELLTQINPSFLSVVGPLASTVAVDSIPGKSVILYQDHADDAISAGSHDLLGLRVRVTDYFQTSENTQIFTRFCFGRNELLKRLRSSADDIAFHFHAPDHRLMCVSLFSSFFESLQQADFALDRIRVMNIGGGWNTSNTDRLRSVCNYIERYVTAEIHIEPGAGLIHDAGVVICKALRKHTAGTQKYLTIDASPELHLRWSLPAFLDQERYGGDDEIQLCGPTVFEGDTVPIRGNFDVIKCGDLLVLSGLVSYSVSWNCTFNGIPRISVCVG
ncbi:hypothetical protein [Cupriavidus basilensis]|uniref:hypothetical protein n=1 Tax=Cupriavidus basilensis TaxID=68895 RepID=UPI0023E7EE40|nr:hypothetical protein [Cupriavidus basilensis]MDF3881436.1 hypothetical protein [Cupriavidus basilensis]